uniref:Uncharacterized protein n=1 Tax=Avena sativa TaxID=4498 RepID=A0ACD5Y5U5_AVESA
MSPHLFGHWLVSISEGDAKKVGSDDRMGEIQQRGHDWLVLMGPTGEMIIGRHRHAGDMICIGSMVKFSSYQATVLSCLISPTEVRSEELSKLRNSLEALDKDGSISDKVGSDQGYRDQEKSAGVILPEDFSTKARPNIPFGTVTPLTFSKQVGAGKDQVSGSNEVGMFDSARIPPIRKQSDLNLVPVQDEFDKMIDDMAYRGITPNPKTPPDPAVTAFPCLDSSMAVFEVDPTPWLPWGHQIIDGGGTRLPRTYYYPSQDPPALHQDFCIAVVEPPIPPHLAGHWREQVQNFLVGPLQRHVIDVQPSMFGVGLFRLSGPNSVNALVQHGNYQIQNRFVRFMHVNDADANHRATLGFRRGWLMFLGIPPDYRTTYDIANAVSTFGQYHFWNNNDPILERALVYAYFPSPQLVPRDVVFGKFATVGGAKETWTAAVFILSAEFSDALPTDEDQMPLDGNPHPMPGQLQHHLNLFVQPQYPEVGWDAIQHPQNNQHGAEDNEVEQQDEVEEEVQESMVLDRSQNSDSSGSVAGPDAQQRQHIMEMIQVGRVQTIIGSVLPPELRWKQFFEWLLPNLGVKSIPLSLQCSPFAFLKRPWSVDFCSGHDFAGFTSSDQQETLRRIITVSKHRPINRTLNFDVMLEVSSEAPIFTASPVKSPKKRVYKGKKQVVQPSVRRFTRSCLKSDGMRPKPVLDVAAQLKKKPRAKLLLVQLNEDNQ